MGLELAEQLGWRLPDVILYPTGGGTGLIGMWKAFAELRELGWLKGEKLPRLITCQSEGCAPIVPRLRGGRALRGAVPERPHGRQRPARAGGGRRFHDARRHPRQRRPGRRRARRAHRGMDAARHRPRGHRRSARRRRSASTAWKRWSASGQIGPDEEVVVFNTGAAQKYPEAVPLDLPRLDKNKPVDYAALAEAR